MSDKRILKTKIVYAIIANRLKEIKSPCGQKKRTHQPYARTVDGFFFTFIVEKHPLGYLLSLSSPSSHLIM